LHKLNNNLYDEIDILIVEDEIILALAIELSLQEMNYNVSGIETSGQNAILHARNKQPDIVLMDINLNSSISGIQAASAIWKSMKIPIIFLTSYCDDKTIKEAMECEPYGYLIKPCRDEELKVSINTALHKHKFFFKNKNSSDNIQSNFLQISQTLRFDKNTGDLYNIDKKVSLTKNERKLFEIITEYPGEISSFNRISTYIWREEIYDMGKLRTLVYRLRVKLGVNPFENVYEEGYRIKVLEEVV
jgi:DNA-binding response OmpR family regulator